MPSSLTVDLIEPAGCFGGLGLYVPIGIYQDIVVKIGREVVDVFGLLFLLMHPAVLQDPASVECAMYNIKQKTIISFILIFDFANSE